MKRKIIIYNNKWTPESMQNGVVSIACRRQSNAFLPRSGDKTDIVPGHSPPDSPKKREETKNNRSRQQQHTYP